MSYMKRDIIKAPLVEEMVSFGLSENEARIYLYLLERGGGVGGTKVAIGTGIHRQYVYLVLPRLIELGLVEQIAVGKRSKYVGLSPSRLEKIAREKVYASQTLIGNLNKISRIGHEQESEVLFGVQALLEHEFEFEELAEQGETQYIIGGNADAFIETVGDTYADLIRMDEKKKIVTYYLGSKQDRRDEKLHKGREDRYHMRYLEKMPEGITHTVVRKDRVCFFSFLNPPTVHVIKSPVVAQNYKDFFMMLWEMAE
jgi:sugar-specific transcriptional regulator TrmB